MEMGGCEDVLRGGGGVEEEILDERSHQLQQVLDTMEDDRGRKEPSLLSWTLLQARSANLSS